MRYYSKNYWQCFSLVKMTENLIGKINGNKISLVNQLTTLFFNKSY